jgi:hypothetical protein
MHLSQQSKVSSTVRCPLCGQDFLIFSDGSDQAESMMNRRIIEHALRTHHTSTGRANVHPQGSFHIPSWSGTRPFLASATLSNLLDSAV